MKTIANLRNVKLIAPESKHSTDTLDSHPLVREHFGERLQQRHLQACREAHSRLYDYYKNLPEKLYGKELPDTLAEMEPLFAAVAHGCLAGRHLEVEIDIFWKRIRRESEAYTVKKLGAYGADLSALSSLFEIPWSRPIANLGDESKAYILGEAGYALRVLGRSREAAVPLQAGLELQADQKDWKNAARSAINISDLLLALGDVPQAVDTARQGVDFADRSGDNFMRMCTRAQYGNMLHSNGKLTKAQKFFKESEKIQQKREPEYQILYGLQGFYFCDLLLSQGQVREVLARTRQILEWAKAGGLGLLAYALDTLSLGRALSLQTMAVGVVDFGQVQEDLKKAVAGLREANRQDYLPRALFPRAALYCTQGHFTPAWECLTEAQEIAERGEMGLYLADFHLEACRLHLAQHKAGDSFEPESVGAETISPNPKNHLEAAKAHLKTAKEKINKMGYHRRDPELDDLRSQIAKIK